MSAVVIVPARGGSKRLPGKNIKLLNDKPLVFHTLDLAVNNFDKVIFTSDDELILNLVSNNYLNSNIFIDKRSEDLSSDASKVIDTVSYYFDENKSSMSIWLMLPTCPLRSQDDIERCKNTLTDEVDSVLTITDYEFPPTLGLNLDDGLISDWHDSKPWKNGNTRSQDHKTIYRPNGALYGSWSKSFEMYRNFYKGSVSGVFMPRERSVDIDTELDFVIAGCLLKNYKII